MCCGLVGAEGPCRRPHSSFHSFTVCALLRFVVVCCSFFKPQLPSAIGRFLERLLPQAVVRYAFLDSNLFFFVFFPASFDAKIVLIGSEYSTQLPGQEEISACIDDVLLLEQ